jgi:histidinol dehydrogenase
MAMGGTGPMRVSRWAGQDAAARERLLRPASRRMFDADLRQGVRAIIEDVRAHGDEAVSRALERFDGCKVPPDRLRVSGEEIKAARAKIPAELVDAIERSIEGVRRFNEKLMERRDWRVELSPGLEVGEKATPIESVGLFVPSGKGSFPSVLVQIGTPAVVAGVPRIVVVVPPVPGSAGEVDPAVLVAADLLGLDHVVRANGPAGIAALALGTASIPKVVKLLGPGSPPVAAAQIEVQQEGCVAHLLLGPSESLILADDSADPRLLAADLLNEAEHGPDSFSILVTDSLKLVETTQTELAGQLLALPEPRRGYARTALGQNGGAIIVADLDEGAELTNEIAPEHMQLVAREEERILGLLRNAGEILIGQWTPVSAANYVIGVPAALPTGRFARVASGVTVEAFTKRSSIAKASREALAALAPTVLTYAMHEGFPAHAAAIRIRQGG